MIDVVARMRADRTEPLGLQHLADLAGMSRFHFVRVFTAESGITPHRFLSSLRVERAKELLIQTSWPITEVCFEVGYNSLGSFTRTFTALVGTSPSGFRKLAARLAHIDFSALVMERSPVSPSTRGPTIDVAPCLPSGFKGVVFIGLFATPIPQGRPIDGTVLSEPVRTNLQLMSNADARFALGLGLPHPLRSTDALLPGTGVLVASEPLAAQPAPRPVQMLFRRLGPLDPPVLVALPVLL